MVSSRFLRTASIAVLLALPSSQTLAGQYVFKVRGDTILINDQPFKILGLRCSNALISDTKTSELINNLNTFKSFGVNTVSVFVMGSRFGDIKGYRANASLDPIYADRLGQIIEAADERGMVVLVGCLYWSTSTANDDLADWSQADANRAIANTVRWLKDHAYRNVFVDPDNEGMAHAARGWSIAQMIDAAHDVDPTIMVAYNHRSSPPSNADLYIHHSPKVTGKPWLDSEATPTNSPGGYWGSYSKDTHNKIDYYNYSRIGRYTTGMKNNQFAQTRNGYEKYNGHILASTWLQCVPNEGVNGPFMTPGGRSNIDDVHANVDTLHPDAGILWWLEHIKDRYGAWAPPKPFLHSPTFGD